MLAGHPKAFVGVGRIELGERRLAKWEVELECVPTLVDPMSDDRVNVEFRLRPI